MWWREGGGGGLCCFTPKKKPIKNHYGMQMVTDMNNDGDIGKKTNLTDKFFCFIFFKIRLVGLFANREIPCILIDTILF